MKAKFYFFLNRDQIETDKKFTSLRAARRSLERLAVRTARRSGTTQIWGIVTDGKIAAHGVVEV